MAGPAQAGFNVKNVAERSRTTGLWVCTGATSKREESPAGHFGVACAIEDFTTEQLLQHHVTWDHQST